MERFADVLKDLIVSRGLSLRKLAKESGVSAVQYSKHLRGAFPTVAVADRIVKYFDCSFDYIFGINDNYVPREYKEVDLSKFVPRYEDLLKSNGISHWKFAKENDLSESCLRHWKYGETPKIESLIIIASGLSGSIDYLLGRYD